MIVLSGFRTIAVTAILTAIAGSLSISADERRPGAIGTPEGKERMQLHWVPMIVPNQVRDDVIQMRVCRPPTDEPVGVAVVNHGSPSSSNDRPKMSPSSCTGGAARYFLDRNLAVAFPLRRGYGASGGDWAEEYGSCNRPSYGRAGLASAADIGSAVAYLRKLPYIRGDRVMVLGQSAGGWATIAYASLNPDNVFALVNVAGGRGGRNKGQPNNNCRADLLIEAAGEYGRTARQPMLWIYTENDSYFDPKISGSMYAAFAKAGGQVEFRLLQSWGSDGHNMFFGTNGSKTWAPLVDEYLKGLASN